MIQMQEITAQRSYREPDGRTHGRACRSLKTCCETPSISLSFAVLVRKDVPTMRSRHWGIRGSALSWSTSLFAYV